ncbi:MAG: flippase-like domain-containing protein [Candidatus Omnitrophica bacterium]|jgi:uncharacterized membrane protein YbhN (UPF0104 family)|nr:flippase-like domain-containing protein [Candidatus Omnitrophota bacterium]
MAHSNTNTPAIKKLNKTNVIFFISTLIALLVVSIYIFKNLASFRKILTISTFNITVFVIFQIGLLIVNTFVLIIYLNIFNKRLFFFDSFGLNAVNTFFNNILVKGGPFIKGYFLKKIHNLSYSDFIFTIASFTLIEFMVAGYVGLLLLLFIYFTRGYFNIYIFLFFSIISLGCFIFIKLPFHNFLKKSDSRIKQKIFNLLLSWKSITKNRSVIDKLFLLALLNFIIFAMRLQYGFHILYGNANFVDCLLISIIGTIANLLTITPAALGVREFLIGATYGLVKGNALNAVVVTVLDRVVSTITIFILGGVFIFYFLNKMRKTKS